MAPLVAGLSGFPRFTLSIVEGSFLESESIPPQE